jgi:hypothetical protein
MPFDPSVVDIMMSEYSPQVKYRLCVGYHIPKGLYSMRKFDWSARVSPEKCTRRTR